MHKRKNKSVQTRDNGNYTEALGLSRSCHKNGTPENSRREDSLKEHILLSNTNEQKKYQTQHFRQSRTPITCSRMEGSTPRRAKERQRSTTQSLTNDIPPERRSVQTGHFRIRRWLLLWLFHFLRFLLRQQ